MNIELLIIITNLLSRPMTLARSVRCPGNTEFLIGPDLLCTVTIHTQNSLYNK